MRIRARLLPAAGPTGAFSTIAAPPPPGSNLKSPVLVDALGVRHVVTHVADWNNDPVVNVPDIFAFLTDWFNGNGDFDGQNGNQVADIFAFLSARFSAYARSPDPIRTLQERIAVGRCKSDVGPRPNGSVVCLGWRSRLACCAVARACDVAA